ncbi:MAG: hypothetical protein ABIQ74_01785 [Chitinophagales bacterium]
MSGSSNANALHSDGKIVLGEHALSVTNLNFGVSGYLSNGVIDSSFGTSIAIQQDGKILTAGYSWDGAHQNISVARFNSDGSLDAMFGGGGSVEFDISGIDDYCLDSCNSIGRENPSCRKHIHPTSL